MKNLKFVFGMLVCIALLTACSSDGDDNGGEEPDVDAFLSVEKLAVPLTYEAKDFLIDVSTNLKTLSVEVEMQDQEDAMWLDVKYSAKNKQLKVSVSENRIKDDGERKATITLIGKNVDPVVITITQDPSAIEHDPYEVEFDGEWNDNWVVDCYMHGTKYDPILFNDGTVAVPNPPAKSYWQNTMGREITVALKLGNEFLTQNQGRQISTLELFSTINPDVSISFALMTSGDAVANDGDFAEYITETYSPNTTIWESQASDVTSGSGANGWFKCNCSSACVIPASGNVFVVAKIVGGGEWYNDGKSDWAEFQWVRQVLNKFTPTYVNFGNAEAKNLYKFVGGTASLNIHMSAQ